MDRLTIIMAAVCATLGLAAFADYSNAARTGMILAPIGGGGVTLPLVDPTSSSRIFEDADSDSFFRFTGDDAMRIVISGVGASQSWDAARVTIHDELTAGGVSSDGTGATVCVKSDGDLGTCSDQPNGSGVCTCG